MKRWEYLSVAFPASPFMAPDTVLPVPVLSVLGDNGWELVSVIPREGLLIGVMKRRENFND